MTVTIASTSTTSVLRLLVAESTPWDTTFIRADSTMPGFKEMQERMTWARARELDETDLLFDPRWV